MTSPDHPVPGAMFGGRVTVVGKLATQKEGTKTNVIMQVESVKEAK